VARSIHLRAPVLNAPMRTQEWWLPGPGKRVCVAASNDHSHGPRIQRGIDPAMMMTAKDKLKIIPINA
jgi:hypothetical protein